MPRGSRASPPPYAALWCKSNFSFLEGASHPEELVEQAHALGLRALALTDRDGVHGIARAHVHALPLELPLLIGSQVTIDDGKATLILLAMDRGGYANLCRLITQGRLRSPKGECRVSSEEVCDAPAGLLVLLGSASASNRPPVLGSASASNRPIPPGGVNPPGAPAAGAPREALALAGRLKEAFGDRLYALIARHRRAEEREPEARLRALARTLELPRVAAVEVLYHERGRRRLQDVLTCIREKTCLESAGRKLRANAEHDLRSLAAMAALFVDDPEAVARTCEVAERCRFSLADLRYVYPSERLPGGMTSAEWLRQLSFEGARWRYDGEVPDAVAAQLERELALIEELDYPGYFLTMWEIVEFCRSREILCQGRGSAANSAVCYCLGITAVDPVRMDLLFERFLSRERPDPPDIDLDIEHERREEVIQHVYEKYGRSRAAMVANVVRYRARSAIRDVGKALGLPETALDRLAKLADRVGGEWAELLDAAGLDPRAPVHRHLVELAMEIQDFPRHLSIHPGGFLLGHEPVHAIVPIENATMAERTVIQWDKVDVEALGLFKVDLLALGSLALIHRCLDSLRTLGVEDLTLATIPHEDPETYDMICRADTVGVFQIESRAQMSMLPRLRPRTFYDLVIEVSIVRPGPIAGDMVHPYLRRRRGEEPVVYPHPCLEPVLKKTLGVPLFQEQVIRLAVVAADYTPGEADQLRRDMAAWRRSGRIERHHQRLVTRMMAKGIRPEFAERVFEQICGFGEYGFPESHAASFALLGYATAWLKCHHPAAFTCALLNAQPLGFYSPATIVEDARRHGIEVRPIEVAASEWDCSLERSDRRQHPLALRMGLRYVKGLREDGGRRLPLLRHQRPFADLEDLVRRSSLDERELTLLAEAGALECLGLSRREALWECRRLLRARHDRLPARAASETLPLFEPLGALETIDWDYRASSHSARGHPLGPLRALLRAQGLPDAHAVNALPDRSAVAYAGLVICRQRPGTANGVVFMTLEDETGFVNLVLWPDVFKRNALLARGELFLGARGKIQNQEKLVHLIVEELFRPTLEAPALPSRDFH
jgi:error-prone DNA polymerase